MARSKSRLVPEVVQSSAMDCGPAALKAYVEGHGVSVSYGRLREACQTDVDGAAIETLHAIAVELGVPVEQVLLPKKRSRASRRSGIASLYRRDTASKRQHAFRDHLEPCCGRRPGDGSGVGPTVDDTRPAFARVLRARDVGSGGRLAGMGGLGTGAESGREPAIFARYRERGGLEAHRERGRGPELARARKPRRGGAGGALDGRCRRLQTKAGKPPRS